ncbi:MAG TPA: Uma2 family endonuclease [Allocoleopsis sp.]
MLTITPTESGIKSQPKYLIYDDGVPMESNRHRIAINALIRSVNVALTEREFFAGGNMFIYYSLEQIKNERFKGSDFFVVLNVGNDTTRKAWVTWEENGRYPDVIVELMSPSTANIDKTEKKDIYEQIFKTSEYYVYDPFDEKSLQGWRLNNDHIYYEIPVNEQGWLFSKKLNLWLGNWSGTIDRETGIWLRFYDTDGNLVPLPEELAQLQAQQAQLQAQLERSNAELAEEKAEQAEIKAQLEREKAEQAEIKAQLEREKAERLARMLRELGVNPDDV